MADGTAGTDPSQIVARLASVFRDVFDDDNLRISRELRADDVQGWDSLTHVRLLLSIERAFSLRFSAAETGRLKNVGDLIDLILKKKQSGHS